MQPSVSKTLHIGAVVLLLATGFFLQVYFLSSYPQPILFGDPGAYYVVGQKLQQAVSRIATGEDIGTVFESVRGLLYFAGVGSLYGLIDSLSPRNIPYFRVVLSGFNTLAMLGCFFLASRISSYAGGIVALVLAVLYAPFSVQTGRLFPDPITGCLFVWSAYLYIRGVQDRSPLWMFGAGMALTTGLFVRSQVFHYVLVLLALVLLSTAASWWRSHQRLVLALVLGCLPWTVVWLGIVRVVGDDLEQIEAFGNFTFKQRYPYGFWQFLDSDGWMGPYRLGQEPFYQAMEARAAEVPELLESYPRQLLFTAGYVASRTGESALMLADNVFRLYDRPANDYKWDYPFAYEAQVRYQQVLLIAALAALAVLAAKHPSWAFVFFLPASLALLHGLSYPWPRFNQPAMPILIAAAGAFTPWAVRHRPGRYRPLLLVGAATAMLYASGAVLGMPAPDLARVLRSAGTLLGLALPFVFVGLPWDRRRTAASAACFVGLAVLVTANDLRSPRWHETSITLGRAEQQISLSQDALQSLRRASEAFLVFDLHIPDGDPRGVRVSLDERTFPADALVPTMPRFGESTSAGGRNRREYRQWWAVRLNPEDLPAAAPAVLRVAVDAPEREDVVLYGDRFRDQERFYEGPSFGDWPHLAQVKLEYDGDYRLPVRLPLESAATQSDYAGIHRIRVITLSNNVGRLIWETAPVAPGPVAVPFYAYSGSRGHAQLFVDGEAALTFPLGSETDFEIDAPPYRLCYRAEERRADMPYGGYVLSMDATDEGAIPLQVRFTSGMSIERMFTSLDTRRTDPKELAALAARCSADDRRTIASFGRIVEAETNSYPADTGRWSVEKVF